MLKKVGLKAQQMKSLQFVIAIAYWVVVVPRMKWSHHCNRNIAFSDCNFTIHRDRSKLIYSWALAEWSGWAIEWYNWPGWIRYIFYFTTCGRDLLFSQWTACRSKWLKVYFPLDYPRVVYLCFFFILTVCVLPVFTSCPYTRIFCAYVFNTNSK